MLLTLVVTTLALCGEATVEDDGWREGRRGTSVRSSSACQRQRAWIISMRSTQQHYERHSKRCIASVERRTSRSAVLFFLKSVVFSAPNTRLFQWMHRNDVQDPCFNLFYNSHTRYSRISYSLPTIESAPGPCPVYVVWDGCVPDSYLLPVSLKALSCWHVMSLCLC